MVCAVPWIQTNCFFKRRNRILILFWLNRFLPLSLASVDSCDALWTSPVSATDSFSDNASGLFHSCLPSAVVLHRNLQFPLSRLTVLSCSCLTVLCCSCLRHHLQTIRLHLTTSHRHLPTQMIFLSCCSYSIHFWAQELFTDKYQSNPAHHFVLPGVLKTFL